MSTIQTRPAQKREIDDETRRIIEDRLSTADQNPKQDYMEALDEVVREGRNHHCEKVLAKEFPGPK